ncbi:MAG: RsbRD N-terminal domain-containing protein, partial [Pseudomonadota bacterium]
ATGSHFDLRDEQWADLRAALAAITQERVERGVTPTEMGFFITALKSPVFDRLRVRLKDEPSVLIEQVWLITRVIDAFALYTNEVFQEASDLGYLEADPTLDTGGIDAGHKLALLAAIAFGARVDFDAVRLEGIERITIEDIDRAADMGFRIKLLGVARMSGRGLEQRMTPCLVPENS